MYGHFVYIRGYCPLTFVLKVMYLTDKNASFISMYALSILILPVEKLRSDNIVLRFKLNDIMACIVVINYFKSFIFISIA